MRFGVQVQHFRQFASPEAIQTIARRAEELGYDSVWVTDHIVIANMPETRRFGTLFYDAILSLTWAAASTRRVRLGTSVLILPYRNPLVAAKQLATLDVLSGGRTILGFGAGWCVPEFAMLGVPAKRRGKITDEYIRAYQELWTNDDPRFQGEFVSFADLKFEPKPLQQPHPPVWIGGVSDAAIRRAARFGDYWHPTVQAPEAIARGRDLLRREAEALGRNPDAIGIAARAHLKILEPGTSGIERRSMIGSLDEIRAEIRRYAEVGVDYFMIDTFYGAPEIENDDLPSVLDKIERFAAEVMPEFQG